MSSVRADRKRGANGADIRVSAPLFDENNQITKKFRKRAVMAILSSLY
jgi:hypothetical protein